MTVIESPPVAPPPSTDTMNYDRALEKLRAEQNLPLGLAAGAGAAAAGAAAWAIVTDVTGYQIGWMAVGIGFLVGWSMRSLGKGVDRSFGLAGAALSLAGCVAGNLLAVCGMAATQEQIPLTAILSQLTPGLAMNLLSATFSPMDLIFYGIAVYEGYQFSMRPVTPQDLARA
ncbi:MAG: hypothetical protein ACREAA_20835 [Candidatus Polarisedimenticolia bacterium]